MKNRSSLILCIYEDDFRLIELDKKNDNYIIYIVDFLHGESSRLEFGNDLKLASETYKSKLIGYLALNEIVQRW